MKAVEKLIPSAIIAVERKMADKGKVNKAYKGYISALGAGIIQSGLLPTLAMYKGNEESDKKKAETGHLLSAIYEVVKSKYNPKPVEENLFDFALIRMQQPAIRQKVITEIMDASIAIKLAIRTFKLEEL